MSVDRPATNGTVARATVLGAAITIGGLATELLKLSSDPQFTEFKEELEKAGSDLNSVEISLKKTLINRP